MGFSENRLNKIKVPLVEETFTNAICYGQTGSGKTTGFILPNVKNRIKLGHGILLYDFKGNLHSQLKALAQDEGMDLNNIHEIAKPWGKKINLIKNMSDKSIEQFFKASDNTHNDSYWLTSSKTLFTSLYDIFNYYNKANTILVSLENKFKIINKGISENIEPTIKNIFNTISDISFFTSFLKTRAVNIVSNIKERINTIGLQQSIKLNKSDKNQINIILNHLQKILYELEALQGYKNLHDDGSQSGKNAVLGILSEMLMPLSKYEYFNEDSFDIANELNKGAIVIINVQDMNNALLSMLNISIYQSLIIRSSSNNKKPISIFIDEAQKVLSKNYIPDVDVCRENKFEYIFSTQDYNLLKSAIGESNASELLRNIIMQISFKTTNTGNLSDNLKMNEYTNIVDDTTYFTSPIYLNNKALFKTEYKYQIMNDAFEYIPNKYKKKEAILKYNPLLNIEDKILLEYKDTREEYIPFGKYTNLVEDFLSHLKLNITGRGKSKLEQTQVNLENDEIININSLDMDDQYPKSLKDKIKLLEDIQSKHTKAIELLIKDVRNFSEQ